MNPSPIAGEDRLVTIDIIRGFALLGIFLVNMPAFHSTIFLQTIYGVEPEYTGTDHWISLFFTLFVEAKFFTIFSFLFGLGFYIFMSRSEEKRLRVKSLYIRRMFALLLFGVVHLVGLWFGDILHTYAIAGIFLLFFYQRKIKTMLIWAIVLLSLIHSILGLTLMIPNEMMEEMTESSNAIYNEKVEEYLEVYENAGYIEWVSYRLKTEVMMMLANLVFAMIPVLAMFLIGLAAGKAGIFHHVSKHLPFLKKARLFTFLISFPIVFFLALLKLETFDLGATQPHAIQFFKSLSGVSLSLFYISALTILLEQEKWRKRLNPLRFIGQMALSNYLFQTIVCVSLFVGLGFYGKVNLLVGTLTCFVIFIVQMVVSMYWLKHFRFGPFEWLWRSFTYWKLQPLKKEKVKIRS